MVITNVNYKKQQQLNILPRFLDVEASSLRVNSYPIEIAWSDHCGHIESYLVNPSSVETWTDWDFKAQQLHGISRELCYDEGIHPKSLCWRMSQSIAPGELIYADGGPFDEDWIDVLYEAGSSLGFAQFRIVHSDTLMLPLLDQAETNAILCRQMYEQLKLEAREKVGGQHRAAIDVQYLIELWYLCGRQANKFLPPRQLSTV